MLFERQPGEPPRAYHGFCHYRDLGPMRSLDAAWRQHHDKCLNQVQPTTRRRPMTWGDWSVRWGWVERAALFDRHLESQRRTALEAEQVEAGKRHARVLQAATSSLMVSVRLALELAASQDGLSKLRAAATDAVGLRGVLADARMAAAHLPALVTAERLTLGMSTERQELIEPLGPDPIAARIVTDPTAMDLALRLLDTIAQPLPTEIA